MNKQVKRIKIIYLQTMYGREQLKNEDFDVQVPNVCQELNEAVILCHDEYKDWRKCQIILEASRDCISLNSENKKVSSK